MNSIDDGKVIDSNAVPEKALCVMRVNCESGSKGPVWRAVQPAKQDLPRHVTNGGMQIDSRHLPPAHA
jgi:hypothetical protein